MLLIAIYALFHIKTLLQTILGFSIRGSRDSNTCKSCHRSWEAGDSGGNFMNIARTGMCKNCYGNYNSLKGFIGK